MRGHYINILLFAFPLNILVTSCQAHNYNKPYITISTQKIQKTRLLCECYLYTSIYDNDSEMKKVMEFFDRQTSKRFREYDERMQDKRKQCKEQCDKDIQKIILKDKIEKELSQHLSTLETNIETNDIPACVCEKSLEDKMEKTCFRCTQNLGGIVAPSSGVLGGISELGLSAWRTGALFVAEKEAMVEGLAAGKIAGDAVGAAKVLEELKALSVHILCPEITESFFTITPYTNVLKITNLIFEQHSKTCSSTIFSAGSDTICKDIAANFNLIAPAGGTFVRPEVAIEQKLTGIVAEATKAATAKATDVTSKTTATLITKKTGAVQATYMGYEITIIASIVAILVTILAMVIIYLILRYRRKKKMKRKLQYIKLLKE